MYELPKDRTKAQPNVFNAKCPARCLLTFLAGKWHLLVIDALAKERWRNGELMRKIEGISQKMLTQTLRDIEREGYISRTVYAEVPVRVEYALTDLGKELTKPLYDLVTWAREHHTTIKQSRDMYDSKKTET